MAIYRNTCKLPSQSRWLLRNIHISNDNVSFTFYRSWLYIWGTRRVSYKKQELLTLCEDLSSLRFCWWGLYCSSFFSYILLCVFTFWVPCCDVRYDFRIAMVGSSITPVVCRGGSTLMYVICICLSILVSNTLSCVFVLFFFVLCTRWQFPWIDHIWLPLQCSLKDNV